MYLHHSFYVGQDVFIKHKHDLYVKKSNPSRASNVFDRLENDKRSRDKKQKER